LLTDLRHVPEGSLLEADVCIVGAGAAGITLARALRGSGLDVCLLESGGADYERETQDLYAGENRGHPYYDLDHARLRFFGGTTAVWGGRVAPLDPIDYERRPWVPHSGWPFSERELAPWLARASEILELPAGPYDERVWAELGARPPAFDPEKVRTGFWRFDPVFWRFGLPSCRDLVEAPDLRIVLHANAVHLQASRDGSALEHVEVATLEGRRSRVRARRFVLATGGIEVPRLLLASNDVHPAGLGNDHDLVGRFFMEHPHGRAATVETSRPWALYRLFRRRRAEAGFGRELAPLFRPGERLQREAGLLNTSVALRCQRPPEAGLSLERTLYDSVKSRTAPTTRGRRLWRLYRRANGWGHQLLDPVARRWQLRTGARRLHLVARGEQAPHPESRVALSGERDALGVPRAELHWRPTALDKRSVAGLVDALHDELQRLGLGRVRAEKWLTEPTPDWPVDPTVGKHPIGGYHHMGTTRMADDPRRGVVDADGRVHGLANLYVAGSSVFPTSGWANPTLTILALGLRLADHLQRRPRG